MKGISPLISSVLLIVVTVGISVALLPTITKQMQEPLTESKEQSIVTADCAAANFVVLSAELSQRQLVLNLQNTGQKSFSHLIVYADTPKGVKQVEYITVGSTDVGSVFKLVNSSFEYPFVTTILVSSQACPHLKKTVQVKDKDLVGYWSFDNDAEDKSGKGHHGILYNGASFTQGVFGSALKLDGVDDWAQLSGDFGINGGAQTLEMWFIWPTTGGGYLFDNRNPGSWYLLKNYNSGLCTGGGNICFDNRAQILGSSIPLNQWNYLAIAQNTTTSRMYLNGVLLTTGSGETAQVTTNLRIGTRYTNDGYLNASIDEARLYTRMLSDEEIQQTYDAYKP